MWDMIISYQEIIDEQKKDLRKLKLLILSMKGNSV
jgi:hypothetical protein